jgi:ankyrin repeat protein
VKNGDEAIVRLLIACGAGVNKPDQEGAMPLHFAVLGGHKVITELLISAGADINKPDQGGLTPLRVATQNGNGVIAESLINAGADINKPDQRGLTPLHVTTQNGNEVIAQSLINAGAHVDKQAQKGATPLHLAVQNGYGVIVRLLIAYGADISLSVGRFGAAVEIAKHRGHHNIRQLLEQAQRANEFAEERLRCGESIKTITEDGAQLTVVFEKAISDQKVALLTAYPHLFYSHLYYKNQLKNSIAKHNIPTQWLLYAAQAGHVSVMNILLQKDEIAKNVNRIQDQNENRAAHIAALYNRPRILEQLVMTGADLRYLNSNGQAPYDIAKHLNHKSIGDVISSYALTG